MRFDSQFWRMNCQHGFGVAGGQHEGGAGSTFGAYRTEQIGRLGALIVGGPGTRAFPGPADAPRRLLQQYLPIADICLFDHLVSASEQRRRHGEAECLRGF